MKRQGQLWAQVVSETNVHLAFAKAAAGKRDRAEVRRVSGCLDETLRRIACDLAAGVFSFGHYRRFTIYEPKERVIHAARFEERIAHHALMNICGPSLDRRLTGDVFACRVGMGRTAAVARAAAQARRHRYFLKMDVRKYFDRNNPSNRNNYNGLRPARAHPGKRHTRGPRLSRRPSRPGRKLPGKPPGACPALVAVEGFPRRTLRAGRRCGAAGGEFFGERQHRNQKNPLKRAEAGGDGVGVREFCPRLRDSGLRCSSSTFDALRGTGCQEPELRATRKPTRPSEFGNPIGELKPESLSM